MTEQWQPIETAPNEEDILLWHDGSKYQKRGPVIGHMMMMASGCVPIFGCTVYSPGDATHWMPLPTPPIREIGAAFREIDAPHYSQDDRQMGLAL